jgi:hypothetical protein
MTDIGLSLVRTAGRAAKPMRAEVGRALTPDDLAALEVERGIKAPPLKKLRETHHQLARLLAKGMKAGEAALVVGYDPSRISILLADPAFANLVQTYAGVKDLEFADWARVAATFSMEVLQDLQERFHEDPNAYSPEFKLEVLKTLADRTGNGPSHKMTNVNVNVDLAARIESARRRVGWTIDNEPAGPALPSPDGEPVA